MRYKIFCILMISLFMSYSFAFKADLDGSGRVDSGDLIRLAMAFGTHRGSERYNEQADFDNSGIIDGEDLLYLAKQFGRKLPDFSAPYEEGQILIQFKEQTSIKSIDSVIKSIKGEVFFISEFVPLYAVKLPEGLSVEEAVKNLMDEPTVKYVEPNYLYHLNWTPNDQYYSYQWHLRQINVEDAWDITKGGSRDVIVAVLDTGIAYEDYYIYCRAPDMENLNIVSPYDFYNGDSHPNDDNGHGTHVTGTIMEATNNGKGVAGIAFNTSLMPIKVCGGPEGSCPEHAIVEGIRWAANYNANVINMSLGGPYSDIEYDAIRYAYYEKGVTIVCAAGNSASSVEYPAAFPETIAVSAVDYNKNLAYYSCYGPEITVAAPGGDLRVDLNGDHYADGVLQVSFEPPDYCSFGYYFLQGTSMATPHVTGTVALIMSVGPRDPDSVKEILTSTAEDLGATGFDDYYGYGLINAGEAVKKARASGGSWGWNN